MATSGPLTPQEFIERERARLEQEAATKAIEAAQAAAKLEEYKRKATELYRLAAELNLGVVVPEVSPAPSEGLSQSINTTKQAIGRGASTTGALVTLKDLVERYRTNVRSPYHNLRFSTRKHYDTCIKHLLDSGDLNLAELKKSDIQRLYDGWTNGGTEKLPMGHALITMLRGLINFGFKTLDDPNCERAALALHHMQFAVVKARSEELTADHVDAIIKHAIVAQKPSIALAQALQFDCGLRQKDVIGEWVPIAESGISLVTHEGQKWLNGLRWEEIDADLVLRHIASQDGSIIEFPLKRAPRVMAELSRRGERPTRGPIIVCETTGRPWIANEFRRWWRLVARKAGVPDNVKNMDSRFSKGTRKTTRDIRLRGHR